MNNLVFVIFVQELHEVSNIMCYLVEASVLIAGGTLFLCLSVCAHRQLEKHS